MLGLEFFYVPGTLLLLSSVLSLKSLTAEIEMGRSNIKVNALFQWKITFGWFD